MKYSILLTSLLALLIMASCGKKRSKEASAPKAPEARSATEEASTEEAPVIVQPLEGKYESLLRPLNTSASGYIPSGRALITIENETLSVVSYLEDDSKVIHIQDVYEGTRCPTLSDDQNGDGLIDIVEMKAATGKALIPLDGDLHSQAEGQDSYPVGTSYTYEKTAEVSKVIEDLRAEALAETSFVKLAPEAALNLEGRVVVVHGTANLARVPETVQTEGNRPRNVTLPITCGVLKRL
jgi:hypothetical protein